MQSTLTWAIQGLPLGATMLQQFVQALFSRLNACRLPRETWLVMRNDLGVFNAGSGAGLGLLYPNLSLVSKIDCPVLVVHVSAPLLVAARERWTW